VPNIRLLKVRHLEKGRRMKAKFLKSDEGEALRVLGTGATVKLDADETGGAMEFVVMDAARGRDLVPHRHPWAETYYILEGVIELQVGARRNRMSAGDFATIPSRAVHAFTVLTDRARFLHVSIGRGATAAFQAANVAFPEVPTPADAPRLLEMASQLGIELVLPTPA
jgi:quercetin dioxygenase-like cupin family protein